MRLVADSMSYEFVRGSKVDYSQELIKSSFEVRHKAMLSYAAHTNCVLNWH